MGSPTLSTGDRSTPLAPGEALGGGPTATPTTAVRPRRVTFVAWGAIAGRSREIAAALGGESRCFFPIGSGQRPPVAVRYARSALGTAAYLFRRRPRVVIATNPPVPGALVAYLCGRVVGAAFVLDSHPGGFGAQGDRVAARLQWLHRFLVRRAAFVMVTDESWCETVRSWDGTALVVHEAPGSWDGPAPVAHSRPRVLVVGTFSVDEPVSAVMGAAALVPECDFLLTGDPSDCPPDAREAMPDNVQMVGFLDADAYRTAVGDADAVLTLTTEPTSVMRAAYEAVYARRPLVVSDWPVSRELFRHARHTHNDAPSIAEAVRSLVADYSRYAGRVEVARREQIGRWEAQRRALVAAVERLAPGQSGDGP